MTPTSSPIRSHAELASRTCSRRECLQVMGTVLVGATACAVNGLAAPTDLRAKAKANIRLGIDASVYSQLPLEEAVRRIRDDGFRSALTTFTFADVRFDPWSPDWDVVQKITACFERHDVRIAALFGYYNVVDCLLYTSPSPRD